MSSPPTWPLTLDAAVLPVAAAAAACAAGSGRSGTEQGRDLASPGGAAKEGLECAVCLSEVADGEKVRTLPKCAHGFHVECIDMWFHSHHTCPLYRAPVGAAADLGALPREDPAAATPLEFPVFPTNVLFWGTHDEVTNASLAMPPSQSPVAGTSSTSSSASGRRKENLVIDIPDAARGHQHAAHEFPATGRIWPLRNRTGWCLTACCTAPPTEAPNLSPRRKGSGQAGAERREHGEHGGGGGGGGGEG